MSWEEDELYHMTASITIKSPLYAVIQGIHNEAEDEMTSEGELRTS